MDFDKEYTSYQLNRGFFRKKIRKYYLKHTARFVRGKAIDLGCGVGDLLNLLPKDSIGLEINHCSVNHCKNRGLNVVHYDPQIDDYEFKSFNKNEYKTIIISHVLEHMENPDDILRKLLLTAYKKKIENVIIIVPGEKGFLSDKTHKTFIDINYINDNKLDLVSGFSLMGKKYFPINFRFFGEYFTHNELLLNYINLHGRKKSKTVEGN